jgi:predicted DNA binding CopG/RHH family protein
MLYFIHETDKNRDRRMNNLDFDNMTIDQLTVALDLDEEERELLESIENDEWVSIPNEKEEITRLRQMAIADRSTQKIEVNLSMQDTNEIYDLAEQLGISVSTIVQEVMHKYLRGELIEASNPLNAMFEENARDVARIGGS